MSISTMFASHREALSHSSVCACATLNKKMTMLSPVLMPQCAMSKTDFFCSSASFPPLGGFCHMWVFIIVGFCLYPFKGRQSYTCTSVEVPELIQSWGVHLQLTKAINQAVGCHYFLPAEWLSPQPLSITIGTVTDSVFLYASQQPKFGFSANHRQLPGTNYTAWRQRHMCVNNLSKVALDSMAIWTHNLLISNPAT